MGAFKSKIQDRFLDALLRGSEIEVIEMLKQHPPLASEGLYKGTTNPICRASYLGYRKLIIILLENGADINQRSSDGRTPVMWAAFRGDKQTIELLVERGADLSLED